MAYIAPEESAFGIGLFERLEADSEVRSMTEVPSYLKVLESIRRNLSNLLNTRVGGSQSAPDLGLVDFNDAALDTLELSLRIRMSIQDCLEKYEPRLINIQVMSIPIDGMHLKFQITAELNSEVLHHKVKLQLLLDQNKKYRVY
jgi:type VI secretion system protein